MATILVGPQETKFVVHQALLCEKSPYFTKALTGSFEESKTGIVKLHDVSPVLFRIVVSWLYYGKIVYTVCDGSLDVGPSFARFKGPSESLANIEADANDTSTWPKQVLVELYVLADRLDIKELRKNTIDALNDLMMLSNKTLHISALEYVCSNTTAKSPLRRLVVDHLAYTAVVRPAAKDFWTKIPHEIVIEVLMIMGQRLPVQLCGSCYRNGLSRNTVVFDDDHPCKDSDQMPFQVDICFYHDHADDEEKKSCQANRDRTVKK
jgi:hypothetical protein